MKKAIQAVGIALLCAVAIYQVKAHTKGIVDED